MVELMVFYCSDCAGDLHYPNIGVSPRLKDCHVS